MQVHNLIQGSEEWAQFRLTHFGASEAAVMLGLSPKTKRTELLRMKHLGLAKEFSDWVQEHILDPGHEAEANARPHVEAMIVEELYPVTGSDGDLSVSCDGLTIDGRLSWEHKRWNEAHAAVVARGEVPEEHMPQCQQNLMLTQAEKLIFTMSDGTPEKMLHVEVLPDPAWFQRIRAGWDQFAEDLRTYVPEEKYVKPVGRTPETLPALRIEVSGQVTASNLAAFKDHALAVFADINTDLQTDQDFSDAEKTVKWCAEVEEKIEAAKRHAMSQAETIDALYRALDDIKAEARNVRLDLDKKVKVEKEKRRAEIIYKAQAAIDEHVRGLNKRLGANWVSLKNVPFGDAIKGKKSLDSMKDAVSTMLANAKIEASALADRLEINRMSLTSGGGDKDGTWFQDYIFLFADFADVGHAPVDVFSAIAAQRIQKHEQAEAERKAQAESARLAKEQAEAARAAAQAAIQTAAAPAVVELPAVAKPVAAAPILGISQDGGAVVDDRRPPINASEIARRLGFPLSQAFIEGTLGIKHVKRERTSVFWREADWPALCNALSQHALAAVDMSEAPVWP